MRVGLKDPEPREIRDDVSSLGSTSLMADRRSEAAAPRGGGSQGMRIRPAQEQTAGSIS
jgi:hypothetical protein